MTPIRRLAVAMLGIGAISAVGTVGYRLVEGMRWQDALYMTVITLSTVGFGEVQPLSPTGRLFTVGLIITAVSTALYLFSVAGKLLAEDIVQDLFKGDAMKKRIAALERHIIVCGYGRLGRIVVDELGRSELPMVIIEADPARQAELNATGIPYLIGSATGSDMLERAGLGRARAIVVGTNSDSDNVFITLSAREASPEIAIHARGESDAALRGLKLAGANHVISAYQMGGLRIAASILQPSVAQFLEISRPRVGDAVDLEELHVSEGSRLASMTVMQAERQAPRLRVVALKRRGVPIQLVPEEGTHIEPEDFLIVIGERGSLDKLAGLAQPHQE